MHMQVKKSTYLHTLCTNTSLGFTFNTYTCTYSDTMSHIAHIGPSRSHTRLAMSFSVPAGYILSVDISRCLAVSLTFHFE